MSRPSSPIVFGSGQGVSEPEPSEAERVATHADDPAIVDELGRRPFAEVIAVRREEAWKAQYAKREQNDDKSGGAFMVHIHGPWGTGKTSVLNFLRAHLQDKNRKRAQRWVVVEFNAWRQQRIRPPWWTLIKEIHAQSARQLGLFRSLLLRARWLAWRVRADRFPAISAALLILFAVLLTISGSGEQAQAVELRLEIITAVFAVGAAVVTLSRSLVFGSARAAQTYTELRSDPLGPIVRLFQKLVKAIRRPVVVFAVGSPSGSIFAL